MADKRTKNAHIARTRRKQANPATVAKAIPLVHSRPVTHARLAAVLDAGDLRYANETFATLLDHLDGLQERLTHASDRRMVKQAKAATANTIATLNEIFRARATLVAFMSDERKAEIH